MNSNLLKEKVSEIWKIYPLNLHDEEPRWLNGWLYGFKKRFKIKEYVYHSKGATVEVSLPERSRK